MEDDFLLKCTRAEVKMLRRVLRKLLEHLRCASSDENDVDAIIDLTREMDRAP